MRAVYGLIASAALLTACQSREDEPLSTCVSRFKDVRDGLPLNGNNVAWGPKADVVYTYDISRMKDDDRRLLLSKNDIMIDTVVGGDSRQAEQNFMKKLVTAAPRALLADKTLYRVRHSGRETSDATIAFGCGLLGPGARLQAIDVTV